MNKEKRKSASDNRGNPGQARLCDSGHSSIPQ